MIHDVQAKMKSPIHYIISSPLEMTFQAHLILIGSNSIIRTTIRCSERLERVCSSGIYLVIRMEALAIIGVLYDGYHEVVKVL